MLELIKVDVWIGMETISKGENTELYSIMPIVYREARWLNIKGLCDSTASNLEYNAAIARWNQHKQR